MHVLLSAYACSPAGVSEAANGWGWATCLAERGVRIHVFTAQRHRDAIEGEERVRPRENLSFSFVEPKFTDPSEEGGWHYLAWQFAAVKRAKILHLKDPFDLVHHITYGSIHVPSQLWRLKIPVVFGPVGGGQVSPFSMRSYFGASQRKELTRTMITKLLGFSPLHRSWMRRMAVVFATNEETLLLARRLGKKNAVMALDTAIPDSFLSDEPRAFKEHQEPLRLLWVGRMMPRKALPLTLDAISEAKAKVTLTIIGDGYPEQVLRKMISQRGLDDQVIWRGKLPWVEVRQAYSVHDAFLFTSLRDSCGIQLLEAMARGLPVITLDHQGASLLVPEEAGFRVPVTNPRSTVLAIAEAIERFATLTSAERSQMSRTAWEKAKTLSYSIRAQQTHQLYKGILQRRSTAWSSFEAESI